MANVCDRSCDGCVYKGIVQGHVRCCNYVFMEDKLRPCPPGEGCTVKRAGRYKLTLDERRARKAQKSREYREKIKAANTITVKCAICGDEFQTTHSRYRYCSKECGEIAHKQQMKKRWGKFSKQTSQAGAI